MYGNSNKRWLDDSRNDKWKSEKRGDICIQALERKVWYFFTAIVLRPNALVKI